MYKIIGADGKEYGPATLEQMKRWVAEGRVNPQTRVLAPGAAEWLPASQVPDLREALAQVQAGILAAGGSPGVFAVPGNAPPSAPVGAPTQGLAITSFVLGLLGMLCLGLISGLPAIVCGHVAHGRARRDPARYGGGGFAIAGFILGYCSIFATIILAALFLPAFARAKHRAQSIHCISNMKQIGLSFKVWELDHHGLFPANVSTNEGGVMEITPVEGDEQTVKDPSLHFQALSNELSTPRILVCPADTKQAAPNFSLLSERNISYELRAYSGMETNMEGELILCPIHGHRGFVDGSVRSGARR